MEFGQSKGYRVFNMKYIRTYLKQLVGDKLCSTLYFEERMHLYEKTNYNLGHRLFLHLIWSSDRG